MNGLYKNIEQIHMPKVNILSSSLFLSKLRNVITKKCLLGPTKYRSFQACPFLLSKLVPQDAFQGTISAAVSSILLKSILNGGGLQAPVILGVDISNTRDWPTIPPPSVG